MSGTKVTEYVHWLYVFHIKVQEKIRDLPITNCFSCLHMPLVVNSVHTQEEMCWLITSNGLSVAISTYFIVMFREKSDNTFFLKIRHYIDQWVKSDDVLLTTMKLTKCTFKILLRLP